MCERCGTLAPHVGAEWERPALDKYHQLILNAGRRGRVRLMRRGFIPSTPLALAEAATRILPIIENPSYQDPNVYIRLALRIRTDRIVKKLHSMGGVDAEVVASGLESHLRDLKKETRFVRRNREVLLIFGGIVLVVLFSYLNSVLGLSP